MEPNADTQQRQDAGRRFVEWLVPRLSCEGDDLEAALVMIIAQMETAYANGIRDAGFVARGVSDRYPASREAKVIADGLVALEAASRSDQCTSLSQA